MSGLTDGIVDYHETILFNTGTGEESLAGETSYVVIANEFTVAAPTTINYLNAFGNTGSTTGIYSRPKILLWADGVLVYSQLIGFSSVNSLGGFLTTPQNCVPGSTYALGFVLPPSPPTTGHNYAKPSQGLKTRVDWNDGDTFSIESPPGFQLGVGKIGLQSLAGTLADNAIVYPTTVWGPWLGGFNVQYNRSYKRVPPTQPPSPLCTPGAQRFTINNPWSYLPNVSEWEIQASTSPDGAQWSSWFTVVVNSGSVASYSHSNLNLNYLYRYRVRVRTQLQESEWTEPTFVGRPALTG